MKAVMYHYVRGHDTEYQNFIYLDHINFEAQLDFFCETYGVVTHDEFTAALSGEEIVQDKILLTFDDGLIDHYRYVLPALQKRNLWGLFFIPTGHFTSKELLDVHRIHYLLGKVGGARLLSSLKELIQPADMIPGAISKFESKTYSLQKNDSSTQEVKRVLNYYLKPFNRKAILDQLMNIFFADEAALVEQVYMSPDMITRMLDAGMGIGAHGHSHTLLSNLTEHDQVIDVTTSCDIVREICGTHFVNGFCYPYGGVGSHPSTAISALEDLKIDFAFSVESRDIEAEDLQKHKFTLPRYDCNQFKFGQASGVKR